MRSSLMGKGNEMGEHNTSPFRTSKIHKHTDTVLHTHTHKTVTYLYQIGACWYLFVYICLLTCAMRFL